MVAARASDRNRLHGRCHDNIASKHIDSGHLGLAHHRLLLHQHWLGLLHHWLLVDTWLLHHRLLHHRLLVDTWLLHYWLLLVPHGSLGLLHHWLLVDTWLLHLLESAGLLHYRLLHPRVSLRLARHWLLCRWLNRLISTTWVH